VTSLALLAALVGGTLVWAALSRPQAPPPVPGHVASAEPSPQRAAAARPASRRTGSGVPTSSGSRPHGVEDLTRGLVLPQARPVGVSIPRLHVASHLTGLGVDETGAMEVPRDPSEAGWYRLGPTPGALGPAVIAGHVTWNGSPGVFFELGKLRRGDRVRVARVDGRVALFEVRRVARFHKTHFPTRAVYGAIDHAGLRLITCGGTYDASAHRYLDNVVAFAALVGTRSTG
jgi:hypothetical protein